MFDDHNVNSVRFSINIATLIMTFFFPNVGHPTNDCHFRIKLSFTFFSFSNFRHILKLPALSKFHDDQTNGTLEKKVNCYTSVNHS